MAIYMFGKLLVAAHGSGQRWKALLDWIVTMDLPIVVCNESSPKQTWWGTSSQFPTRLQPPYYQTHRPCTCQCDGHSGLGGMGHTEEGVSILHTLTPVSSIDSYRYMNQLQVPTVSVWQPKFERVYTNFYKFSNYVFSAIKTSCLHVCKRL